MRIYSLPYRLKQDKTGLTPREVDQIEPRHARVVATTAQRAISALTNDLKAQGAIGSKADVEIIEAKLVP